MGRCAHPRRACAVQLNDTHPAIGIAELMASSSISTSSIGTRHGQSLGDVLLHQPHFAAGSARNLAGAVDGARPAADMQLIYLINAAHLDGARRRGFVEADTLAQHFADRQYAGRRVRMGMLAFMARTKSTAFRRCTPNRCVRPCSRRSMPSIPAASSTRPDGITFRRWLIECNPDLAQIIR